MKSKICNKCKQEKSINEFYKELRGIFGVKGVCKKCIALSRHKNYKHQHINFPWIKRFHDINQKCNNPKDDHYCYYGKRGIQNRFNSPNEIKFLWLRDKAYLMKKPSIDRIDNDGHYCLENCRFIELGINSNRNKMKIILQFDKQGNFIKEWECAIYAEKALNIAHASVWKCANNKVKTAGGFIWRYK